MAGQSQLSCCCHYEPFAVSLGLKSNSKLFSVSRMAQPRDRYRATVSSAVTTGCPGKTVNHFHNFGKQRQILTKFCQQYMTSNIKQVTAFQ